MTDKTIKTRLEADLSDYERGMSAAQQQLARFEQAIGAAADEIPKLTKSLSDVSAGSDRLRQSTSGLLGELRTLVGSVGLGYVAAQAVRVADAYTQMDSRLRLVTTSAEQAAAVQTELYSVAQASRQAFLPLAELYTQVARATADTGISQQRLIGVTRTLSQTLAISGAGAEAAQAALVQLSQGLASGTLRGDELNSVLEQTPRLAQAIADGLGVSIGQLRAMGAQGEITADAVIGALERSASRVQDEFSRMTPTVGQSFTELSNAGGRFVDTLNDALGVTNSLAGAVHGLASALDRLSSGIDSRVKSARADVNVATRNRLNLQLQTMDPLDFRYAGIQAQVQALNRQETFAGGFDAVPQDTGEWAAARSAANRRLSGFLGGDAVQSASGAKLKEQTALLKSFADAVQGFEQSSHEYQQAYDALMQGLANIDAKAAKKKSGPAEKKDELQALLADLSGLRPEFEREWGLLAKAYESGKFGATGTAEAVARLTEAQAALLAQQPAVRDATREEASAQREAQRELELAAKATESYLSALEDQADKAQDEIRNWGLTASEIERTTIARKEEQLAVLQAQGGHEAEIAALEREIAARQRLASALAAKEVRQANAEAAKAAAAEWEKVYDDVGRAITDSIFEGGRDGWDLLKKSIEATIIRAYVQPVITQSIGAFLGAAGLGPGAGAAGGIGALGGVGNLLGLGSLSGLGGFFGQAGLGFSGASTSSLLAAGNAAFGAGQIGAGLGSYVGAAGPYALAAYAGYKLLDSLGAFAGSTPHRGGAAYSTIGGGSGAAGVLDAPGFGLDWGAYRSGGGGDRSAAVDAAVAQVVNATAADIAARAERYGGDASGLRVVGKFAADGKDASQGGYAVYGAGGSVLYGNTGKYSKDKEAAFGAFGGDALRAEVAALQGLDLGEWFRGIFDAVDPLTDSLDVLTQALTAADEVARQASVAEEIRALGTRDAMEDVRVASLSASAAWFESAERIRDAAASGAYSVDQLSQLASSHYANEVRLLQSIESASRSAAETFDQSARNIQYGVLDDRGKYDFLDQEAARYLDVLRSLTDPTEIERYAQKLNSTINTAFGLLDPAAQAKYADQFVERLEAADTLVQDRLDAAREAVQGEQKSLAADLATAAAQGISRGVDAMVEQVRKAGLAIPTSVPVNVRVSAAPGLLVELGDGP